MCKNRKVLFPPALCGLHDKPLSGHNITVFATVLEKAYKTGLKITEDLKQTMEIVFDDYLPRWNYTAKPKMS
jgi:hypothetical protein